MSGATVTPSMRAVGWNVHFTTGQEEDPGAFAGIYQAVGSDLVTFRHVCDELRLCFEFPDYAARSESDDADNHDSWADIAFALTEHPNSPGLPPVCPPFVTEE
ncbi:Fc.00g073340.m01.CDS01 [Cosmosporella sp. VM-42]